MERRERKASCGDDIDAEPHAPSDDMHRMHNRIRMPTTCHNNPNSYIQSSRINHIIQEAMSMFETFKRAIGLK
eukprot:scaffold16573_cov50-Attheya_sp.AAC.2